MDDDKQDDERARLLAEMRAYGSAAPFVPRQQTKPRPNVYDKATGEWLRSKTFRWILGIACSLPFILLCSTVIGIVAIIVLVGYGMIDAASWLVDLGG